MSRVGKSLIGIAAVLNVIMFAGASLPYPFNFVVLGTAILIAIGVLFEYMDWA